MRLFTALWLPPAAVAALQADVPSAEPPGWRLAEPSSWHVTLAFHGEADAGVLARRLERAAGGGPAPRVRVAGAGAFPRVRWAGVEPAGALADLVGVAGGDPDRFVAHVTVLRRHPRAEGAAEPAISWAGHVGPWWTPPEVLLVASEAAKGGGPRYRPVHRVPLQQ